MTYIPDFAEIFRQGQQAVRDAGDAYVETVRSAFAQLPTVSMPNVPGTFSLAHFELPAMPDIPGPVEAVDNVYDQVHTVLEIQRGVAKRLTAVVLARVTA